MKKNIAMRVAAFLFILTMISTCAFATTFAKYTTSAEAKDSARVAKWGVVLTVDGEDAIFAKEYNNQLVLSTDKVVAPGTKGSELKFSVKGTPEVAVNVELVFELKLENWTVEKAPGKTYIPLIIKIDDQKFNGLDFDSTDAFITEITNYITTRHQNGRDFIAVGDSLADTFSISWEWPFSTTEANDELDTALGNWVLVEGGKAPSISLNVSYTVTQAEQ